MNRLLLGVWLTLVWVLLWGDPTPANIVAGVLLATVLVVAFPPGPDRRSGLHPLAVLRFGVYFAGALVSATVSVARSIVRPELDLEQGIVAVPLKASSPVVVAFVANTISLTPGTLTVDIRPRTYGIDDGPDDRDAPTLYVHCLVVDDPEAVRRGALRVERLAVDAFGTPVDREALFGGPARADTAPQGGGG